MIRDVRAALEAAGVELPSHFQLAPDAAQIVSSIGGFQAMLAIALGKDKPDVALAAIGHILWYSIELALRQGLDIDCAWLETVLAHKEEREPDMAALIRSKP